MYTLKKLIKLHHAEMMIKDYRLLTKLHHVLMVQLLEKHVKQSC